MNEPYKTQRRTKNCTITVLAFQPFSYVIALTLWLDLLQLIQGITMKHVDR